MKEQIPENCQLCERWFNVIWKCCDCALVMCTKCKEKVHSKFKKAKNHRIIDIKRGRPELEETSYFDDVDCKLHNDQAYCAFCETCAQPVCVKCITKIHNGHNLIDEEEYEISRKKIKDSNAKLEQTLLHLTKVKEKIRKIKMSEFAKYNKSKSDILAQKKIVENLVEELINELDDKWKEFNQDLELRQNEVEKMEKRLHEQSITVDEVIKSKEYVQFLNKLNQPERPMDDDEVQINIIFSSVPMFVPREVTTENIGTLKNEYTSVDLGTKIKFRVLRQFISNLMNIHYTETCSDGTLWVGDGLTNQIQLLQINGNELKELSRLDTVVLCMAHTPGNELLISSGTSTLKLVSRTGEIKDSQFRVTPLRPIAVHVTSSSTTIIGAVIPGDVLPATRRSVIIKMDKDGNRLAEYELDNNSKPLFTYPYTVTSTNDGNICVVDTLDKDWRGRVVVLSPNGNVINIYTGQCDISNKLPFRPCNAITTAANNIVVVEMYACTIHVLDSEGKFITCYNTKELGIVNSFSLAASTQGKLYIGTVSSKLSPENFKSNLYEVEFSGF